jgi:tryptophan-rich sensory protein
MNKKSFLVLIAFIFVSEAAGFIGSLFTVPAIPSWYASLIKPEIAPPNWVFAPVWTILFALMGFAAFLIWQHRQEQKRQADLALDLFFLQLGLNLAWSAIFFGWQAPAAAFVEIIILWLAILATIVSFARLSRLSAWLLVPYFLWVSFAAYLNYLIAVLN